MKPHKIHPISVLRLIWLSIWIFFLLLSIGAIVGIFIEEHDLFFVVLVLICGIIGLVVSFTILCLDFKKGVKFDANGIKVEADVADKKGLLVRRFQHKTEIAYNEIDDILLIASDTDSRGRKVENVFIKMPYIVFKCKDGKQKAINVYYFNKKQKIRIIDEIRQRALEAGNILNIPSGEVMWNDYSVRYR
ncbi:MAG: hypothetical protein K2O28_00525 [Clostridia bacterium]|nr:hypothetical protein [Clostridia bacterium]